MKSKMIQKIKNKISKTLSKNKIAQKLRKNDSDGYLDLTSKEYRKDKKWQLIGLEIRQRAYNKKVLKLAILVIIFTSFIPGPNIPGFWLASKLLWRFG